MASYNNYKIVVWERLNKLGKWCPYSAEVCHLLEECSKEKVEVCLEDVEEELKNYSVNFHDMVQISNVTGTKCPIRRRLCDSLCVLGRGFSWQWQGDHNIWQSYEVDVNDFIDRAFLEGKTSVNLSKKFPGYNFEIVFSKMIQISKNSKRKRKIRRAKNSSAYPTVPSPDNVSAYPTAPLLDSVSTYPTTPSPDSESEDKILNTVIEPTKKSRTILSPEVLAEEIPGTTELIQQVNLYKRNVESPEIFNSKNSNKEEAVGHSSAKVQKISAKQEKIMEQASSTTPTTTVALVNGKPWTDSWPPHTPQGLIKPVPGIDPLPKVRRKKGRAKSSTQNVTEESDILKKYTEIVDLSSVNSEEQCIICCESLSTPSSYNDDKSICKLSLCSHTFHKACIEAMFNSSPKDFLQCPSCKKIHGEKCGIQPPGDMIYHILPYSLPGYPDNETIRIIYDIHSGTQGPEHPNPGKKYTARGFPRHCYLPDNEMGRKILRLLVKAWKRRLIFTIGQSSTTGEENTVTWNEIHHKTEFGCNRRGHGYPDPNYFSNILAELEAHGVVDDDSHEWQPA